ncbi:unnamed protein product [Calicophoron daubneyi]|uniref:Small-subunit processome Utp12 domain-containing protein n=1 Tax=Calicophoron daubneyi TaxID=300641 RepID=A0AAV2TIN1_CALDB
MKVTKTYQRYTQDGIFGIITSTQPKIVYLPSREIVTFCVSGAGENAVIWNLRTSEMAGLLERNSGHGPVTSIGASLSPETGDMKVGVGYSDGWINLFDAKSGEIEAHFRAGRTQVSCIQMKNEVLVCASDSDLNVLDIVSGTGSRLKGHRGIVTCLALIRNSEVLVSSAQDSFIKFWDLKNQHCFATLTGHSGPVWSFAFAQNESLLCSGSADSLIRVWGIKHIDRATFLSQSVPESVEETDPASLSQVIPLSEHQSLISTEFLGHVQRTGSRRVHTLKFDLTGTVLFCQSFERILEIFRLLDEEAKTKRLRKKIKKAKDKGLPTSEIKLEVNDILRPVLRVDLAVKPASLDCLGISPVWKNGSVQHNRLRFVCALKNNSVAELEAILPSGGITKPQSVQLTTKKVQKPPAVRVVNRIIAAGHRSIPIACCLTSDALGIFSLAQGEAKLWSRKSLACLATLQWHNIELDNTDQDPEDIDMEAEKSVQQRPTRASAIALAPGDRHVVIGFESGHILLFDVNSKSLRQNISGAHAGAVRGLSLSGDKKGIVSGGADKQVGFYVFDLKTSPGKPPGLCLVQSRAKETVADQITCLACSPDNRLIVIGLANFHIDVFFADSFKRIHSLYGHASPVTCVDVSSDSRLVITGSADKAVRLWELQFGNCQRRFTSHMDPVTSVRFIPYTPLAVSADMGGIIKQWDVSKLREVATLKGHTGGVTCLSTAATNAAFLANKFGEGQKGWGENRSKGHGRRNLEEDTEEEDEWNELYGGLIVSGGRDFSIRVWAESEDLLVLEEEAELAREAEEDEELVKSEAVVAGAMPSEASETGLLGRPTVNTRDAADMLMEAMDIYDQESAKCREAAKGRTVPPPHPIMTAKGFDSPEKFLLSTLATLRAPSNRLGGGGAGLEHALGAITTEHARRLLPHLVSWLSRGWEVELVGRALRHLVTLHFGLFATSEDARESLELSRQARWKELSHVKSLIGMNLAGLNHIKKKIEESQEAVLFQELLLERDKRSQRQKAKRSRMALILPG